MNDIIIENMKVFYDNQEKKFLKALVTLDGKEEVIRNSKKIEEYIVALKQQEGVEAISSLPSDVFQCAFKYKEDGTINQSAVDWANANIASQGTLKLNRTSPYEGKKTENVKKPSTAKKVAIAVGLVALVAVSVVGCHKYMNAKDEEPIKIEDIKQDIEKMENPSSWEEYLKNYQDTFAKEFFKDSMYFVDSSIRIKTIGDEKVTYGITPKQADMVSIYYDSSYYSNEELLSILGDYSLTGNLDPKDDINNVVNDYTKTVIANLCLVESEDDFITFKSKDEEVNELNNKYESLWLKFMKADAKKEKKAIREEFEEALSDDFIDAADGVINLQEHPAAHLILNTYPAAFTIMGYPLDDDLNKILVGTEANIDVAQVGTIPESRGLVDDACDIVDRRLENFEDYRYHLMVEDAIIDRENERGLLQDKDFIVLPSRYDELTENTFDYDEVMVPLRDDVVKAKYPDLKDVDLEELEDILHEALVEKVQQQQLNNKKPFHPTENPTGGVKGDVYEIKTEEKVEVPEQNLTVEEKQEAIENVVLPEGVMTEEEVQKDIEETQNEVDNLQAEYDSIYNHYKNGGTEANLPNANWKNHPLYDNAKTQGIKASSAGSYITNEGATNTIVDENGNENAIRDHDDNPNQQVEEESTKVEVVKPEPTPTPEPTPAPTPTPEPDDKVEENDTKVEENTNAPSGGSSSGTTTIIPEENPENSHQNNPNQNISSSVNGTSEIIISPEDMEDIIPGTLTTDDEGVWIPGDEDFTAQADLTQVYALLAELAVEEMANSSYGDEELTHQKLM